MPNFNTATKLVIQSIAGINAIDADKIIQQRQFQQLKWGSIYNILGKHIRVGSMGANFFPSKYLRISLWEKDSQQKKVIHVELTPFSTGYKPWRVNTQYYMIDTPSTLAQ
jgi:hypothetical protein